MHELIIENKDKFDNLLLLFKKCYSLYDDLGGDEPFEDSLFNILDSISREAKKLPKEERKSVLQELVNLTSDYDFLWDGIDGSGLKLNFKNRKF